MTNSKKITLTSMSRSRGFQISGLRGYTLSIGIGAGHYCDNYSSATVNKEAIKSTSTMEVAVMHDNGGFACLPHDVASYVPVSRLGALIEAVEQHDWAHVCFLCGVDNSDTENKFPPKD
jgi:hypothetical protein